MIGATAPAQSVNLMDALTREIARVGVIGERYRRLGLSGEGEQLVIRIIDRALETAHAAAAAPLHRRWRSAGLTAAIARAGLTHRKIGAHVLRHSTATWLADENVDMRKIQKMLGHRNIKTTDEIYAKYRRGYLSEAAAVIDLKLRRSGA